MVSDSILPRYARKRNNPATLVCWDTLLYSDYKFSLYYPSAMLGIRIMTLVYVAKASEVFLPDFFKTRRYGRKIHKLFRFHPTRATRCIFINTHNCGFRGFGPIHPPLVLVVAATAGILDNAVPHKRNVLKLQPYLLDNFPARCVFWDLSGFSVASRSGIAVRECCTVNKQYLSK